MNLHNIKHFRYMKINFEMKIYNAHNKIHYLSSESNFLFKQKHTNLHLLPCYTFI